jgi:hypothetical protein
MSFNEIEKTFPDGCTLTFKVIGMSEFNDAIKYIENPDSTKQAMDLRKQLEGLDEKSNEAILIGLQLRAIDSVANNAVNKLIRSKAVSIKNGSGDGTKEDAELYVDHLPPDEQVKLFMELKPDFEKNSPSQSPQP